MRLRTPIAARTPINSRGAIVVIAHSICTSIDVDTLGRLLVLAALACASSLRVDAPKPLVKSSLLKLRGGGVLESFEALPTVTKVGVSLYSLVGAATYISPKGNLAGYGVTDVSADALAFMRGVGAWQLALACLLVAPAADAHAYGHLLAAAAIFLSTPLPSSRNRHAVSSMPS